MQQVLFVVGPTAVGKTTLSIQLAQQFNGEIISGDSMQVYRQLNIGTAKVTPKEAQGIPHHLIDICNIDQRYSVADFCHDASKMITDITQRNKLPIVVGGTGFYLQALIYGLKLGGDHYQSNHIRQELNQYADDQGNYALWKKLKAVDPVAANHIPVPNRQRVVRALEVFKKTGHQFSQQHDQLVPQYNAFIIGLNTDRQLLYQRINERVDQMISAGLMNEAQWLFQNGGLNLPSGKGIGYREWNDYFHQKMTLSTVISNIKKDSRHYAKRQLTWFRNKMNVKWYDIVQHPTQIETLETSVSEWLQD